MNIFIHGGAWIIEEAKNFAFPAEMFNRAGAHYLAVDFTNVRETKGDLMPLAQQVRSAIAWIYKNAASFGGDPNRIYISGHSSGGHLASVAFTTDWTKDLGLPADVVKGGLFVSGMYDLKPVRLSSRSTYVAFTDAVEHALSPQRHLDHVVAPMIIAYGTQETPEFQRQAHDFAAAAKVAGKSVDLLIAENYNHFEAIETMANPYGVLGRAALSQMRLLRS
jgi:arylformamidase